MDEFEGPSCPMCERIGACGEGALLGALGSLVWFRCIQCGIDFNVPRESLPVDVPSVA